MRIAVSAQEDRGIDSTVAEHFGHAEFFVFVDVENGQMTSTNVVPNPYLDGHAPGQVPAFISEQKADVMLSGGMGGRAIQFFEGAGVQVATGAHGSVREAIERYLGGALTDAAACDESVRHGHG